MAAVDNIADNTKVSGWYHTSLLIGQLPSDMEIDNCFILVLGQDHSGLLSKEFDHNELFSFMRKKMGHGGFKAWHFGGSNDGKPQFDEDLFTTFIHQSGTTCRKGVAATRLQVAPKHLPKRGVPLQIGPQ
jgi:hypothetical protein